MNLFSINGYAPDSDNPYDDIARILDLEHDLQLRPSWPSALARLPAGLHDLADVLDTCNGNLR